MTRQREDSLCEVPTQKEEWQAGAIKGRHGKQVERTQQKVERKDDAEQFGEENRNASIDRMDYVREPDAIWCIEDVQCDSSADHECCCDHQEKVGRRSGEGHQGSSPRRPKCPSGIVRSARPANHPPTQKDRKERHEDHTDRLSDDVRRGVERDLTAAVGSVVSELECNP